jgi:hypothetical protein
MSVSDVGPTHLSLFTFDRVTSRPLARLPMYAEVVAPLPPEPPDARMTRWVGRALALAGDNKCLQGDGCRERMQAVIGQVLATVLSRETRDLFAKDEDDPPVLDYIAAVFRDALESLGVPTFSEAPDHLVRAAVEEAARAVATERGYDTNAPTEGIRAAYALGLLATDHVGYASYDLSRLPQHLIERLRVAAQEKGSPGDDALLSIRVRPYGSDMWFDALEQRRIASKAIVMRIGLDAPSMPTEVANLGILSLQHPTLVDWQLSPASFAMNPGLLIGADGCETVLPANFALQEFNLHQVVALDGVDPLPGVVVGDGGPHLKAGFVNEYRLSWYPVGHSLGQIVYSCPLAPGESVRLAVVDWTRRDEAQRDEDTKIDERLVHELRRDRTVSETMHGAISETQSGGSFMAGLGESLGVAAASSGMGLAAGLSLALGGSSSSTEGSRDITGDTVQRLNDNVAQSSVAVREIHSTVVVQSAQSEHEAIETRTIANYNHSHALTILYYEVLRHYRVVSRFVRRRPAILTDAHPSLFFTHTFMNQSRLRVRETTLLENAGVIRAALLEERYNENLDALERKRHRSRINALSPKGAAAADTAFEYFLFEVTTGGLVANINVDDEAVWIKADLRLNTSPNVVHLNDAKPMNPPGSFTKVDAVEKFTGTLPAGSASVTWGQLDALVVILHLTTVDDASIAKIVVTGVDSNAQRTVLFEETYPGHVTIDVAEKDIYLPLIPLSYPPPAPPPVPPEEIEDEAKIQALFDHLVYHRAHYDRALRRGQNHWQRVAQLEAVETGSGSLSPKVDPRPLDVIGDFVAYRCTDPDWVKAISDAYSRLKLEEPDTLEQLITLPTRGIFAEAKLGHCNASEKIDNTRFWDWQQSPIPSMAPEIAPIQAATPTPEKQDLATTQFPQSLVNIVSPPAAPDPTGLTAALSALATPNIFRDMSGRAEVADLLKRLSDNTIGIAQAANRAREIQATYGSTAGPGSAGSAVRSLGGQRAGPTQPSAFNRDLGDKRQELKEGVADGLITREAAEAAYTADALALQNVDTRFSQLPANVTKQQLLGLVGEQNLIEALTEDGLIVLYDWSKTVATPGIDVIAIKRTPVGDKVISELWLIDNKAQIRGIADAPALTGPQFSANLQEVRDFLAKEYPNKAVAAEAITAIDTKSIRKVIGNAWSGTNTTFTQSLFTKPDVHVYDVRLAKGNRLFSAHADWRVAFKALPKGVRRIGMRGAALHESSMLVLAVAAGALWVARDPEQAKQVVGELAANAFLDGLLSLVPGGWAASIVLTFESDNEPLMKARKREETIDKICGSMADFAKRPQDEQDAIRKTIGSMLDDPLNVTIPQPPQGVFRQILPGLWMGPDGPFIGTPPTEA